jgi:3-deoxy-D-arabino-heptulosonate 7-phosphate (DAHP) synthase class II
LSRRCPRGSNYDGRLFPQRLHPFPLGYCGHGSSEGEARGGYSTPAYTVDILNGMAAVKTQEVANTDRIGMWGHSASFNCPLLLHFSVQLDLLKPHSLYT